MAEWTQYQSLDVLLDVTVGQIGANATVESPDSVGVTVSGSDIALTPGGPTSTRMSNGYVADGRVIEISSPVDNAAATTQFPDVQISFSVDGKDTRDIVVLDASYAGNMFPRNKVTRGERQVLLGESMRKLTREQQTGGSANQALRMTGFKIADGLTVNVKSILGFGNNGTVVRPLRIRVLGERYKNSDLLAMSGFFNPSIALFQQGSPEFHAVYQWPAFLSTSTFTQLPSGNAQLGNNKVFRRINYATNGIATGTSGYLVFSRLGSVGGGPNNVADTQHDLGDDFSANGDMFLYQQFGVRIPSGSAYVGFRVGDLVVPQDTPNGRFFEYQSNDLQYGESQPQAASSGTYFALPDASDFTKLMVLGNAVAPFISTSGLTSFAAGTVSMAKSGILVTGK